jgi:NTE family protein
MPPSADSHPISALVLAGGGARGAYEAGVLAHVFEHILPELGPERAGFDITSGTSVGAIHASYSAATTHLSAATRTRRLVDTWSEMELGQVLRLDPRDLLGVPLRALGIRSQRGDGGIVGGLVDVAPLERLVEKTVPWNALHANLHAGRGHALCISCTEVRSGRVTVFMDGPLADPAPWQFDPNASTITTPLTARHVRASAAIPFLFPSVRLGDRYYVDGGLRMNTPLSPALRLRAERILLVTLKHPKAHDPAAPAYSEDVITQPAFLIGKVLDALTMDQLEHELHHIHLINALLDQGEAEYGEDFTERINVAIRAQRGVGFRKVSTLTIRPSEDIGRIAAACHRRHGGARALGLLGSFVAQIASRGVPRDEADLLSYLYFDGHFTRELVALGREDARAREADIFALLTDPSPSFSEPSSAPA